MRMHPMPQYHFLPISIQPRHMCPNLWRASPPQTRVITLRLLALHTSSRPRKTHLPRKSVYPSHPLSLLSADSVSTKMSTRTLKSLTQMVFGSSKKEGHLQSGQTSPKKASFRQAGLNTAIAIESWFGSASSHEHSVRKIALTGVPGVTTLSAQLFLVWHVAATHVSY